MPKPFKFRYVNEITGGFVLLVLILLLVGVFVAGHAQKWFEPIHIVRIVFPPEGSLDLQRGAEVKILGAVVGTLEEINVADDGGMSGIIRIRGDFIRFVRTDSRAIAKKKFGLAGDAFLEITKGNEAPLPENAVLKVEKDTEITELIQEVVRRIEEVVVPTVEQVKKAIEQYTRLAGEYTVLAQTLSNPEGNLQQLLQRLMQIADGLEKGEGTAGQLLRDPSLAEELRAITVKINQSLAEIQRILDDVKSSTGVVKDEMNDATGVVLQTRETIRETEKLIEALQRHWLLRGYVEKDAPVSLTIPPAALSEGRRP
jgi:phospholipid/cholesterol/gamma-HCH transport system substrate-binding protein